MTCQTKNFGLFLLFLKIEVWSPKWVLVGWVAYNCAQRPHRCYRCGVHRVGSVLGGLNQCLGPTATPISTKTNKILALVIFFSISLLIYGNWVQWPKTSYKWAYNSSNRCLGCMHSGDWILARKSRFCGRLRHHLNGMPNQEFWPFLTFFEN